MLNKIGKIIYGLVIVTLFVFAGLVVVSTLNIPGNYKLMVVLSGSMEPAIKTGSVVVVKPEKTYKVGDIITFKEFDKEKITTTHRIFSVDEKVFVTKGDANKVSDSAKVMASQIIGKTVLSLPYLGYPVNFAKTQEGLIILVIIPAVIIIYSELLSIKNEVIKFIQDKKKNE